MSKKKHRLTDEEQLALTHEDGQLFHDQKGRPIELGPLSFPLADTHGHLFHAGKDESTAHVLRAVMGVSDAPGWSGQPLAPWLRDVEDAGLLPGDDLRFERAAAEHERFASALWLARAALCGVGLLGVPVDCLDLELQSMRHEPPEEWFKTDEITRTASGLIDLLQSWGVKPHTPRPKDLLGNVFLLVGAHPYTAVDLEQAGFDNASGPSDPRARLYEKLLDRSNTRGVGEIGLDYGPWGNKVDHDMQKRAFARQLRWAHERNLPVELHIRDADGDERATAHLDALRILEREGVPKAGCDLHCFTSGPEVMRPFVEMGCYIAFGGAVTFSRSDDIREAAVECPAHLLLSETDSPYMAPVPLRGTVCEPAMVSFSAATVARVRADAGVATYEETSEALWNNAQRFFGLE